MQDAQQILGFSLIIVTLVSLIVSLRAGLSGYAAIFGSRDFKYHFDKSKVPLFIYATVGLAVIAFVYGLVVARNIADALWFCSASTFFGGIGLAVGICYAPKHSKKR